MSKWIEEELEPGLRASYGLKKVLASTQSKWQTVDVVDLECFGRALMIDGLIQSCQIDECVYHECLVHPALLMHACPKTVYIGGGGEGSTAREVLRHSTVERCVMVDIDEDVVNFCREHLPENKEAFADPRLELVIDDAKAVLENSPTGFDVIIMDLDDPLEGGPCYQLYTTEFYAMIKAKLNPGGIFVTQSGQAGMKRHDLVWSPVHNTLKDVFPVVRAYNQASAAAVPTALAGRGCRSRCCRFRHPPIRLSAPVLPTSLCVSSCRAPQAVYSFMDEWGWNIAFTEGGALLEPAEVDRRIAERIKGTTEFLDGESYRGIFSLSKMHRKTLAEETRILSVAKGTFATMHSQGLCVAEK